MTLKLTMPESPELKPRITVFGVGGAGGNAIDNMIEKALEGVEFVVANTDSQALEASKARSRIQMGVVATQGLGAGARPSVGAAAAEETIDDIIDHLTGTHMCFITAGMGGGTGTGAAPIIAQAARELGVLTVGVVTKPFQFEGLRRMKQAEEGIEVLQKVVDTLIIIPNQNLFRLANEKTTCTEAFSMADDVLYQGVKGVTDLMVRPGLMNLDFADVSTVMDEMGKAMMGTGEATGEDRAIQAAEKAIANPLLDEISLNGARGVLINVTGGDDLTLFELDEATNLIREKVAPDANIIVGSTLDPHMDGVMRVSVVATGIDANSGEMAPPATRRNYTAAPAQTFEEPVADDLPEPAYPEPEADDDTGPVVLDNPVADDEPRPDFFDTSSHPSYAPTPQPEPVHRPQVASFAPSPRAVQAPVHSPAPEEFIAPQPRPAGAPSPEALERLRVAVAERNGTAGAGAPHQPAAPAHPSTQGGRRGFGISNLIGKVTGNDTDQSAPHAGHAAVQPRHEPTQMDPDQERSEIPAFLRRQAN